MDESTTTGEDDVETVATELMKFCDADTMCCVESDDNDDNEVDEGESPAVLPELDDDDEHPKLLGATFAVVASGTTRALVLALVNNLMPDF